MRLCTIIVALGLGGKNNLIALMSRCVFVAFTRLVDNYLDLSNDGTVQN